jgi:hypothetical protein
MVMVASQGFARHAGRTGDAATRCCTLVIFPEGRRRNGYLVVTLVSPDTVA